MARSPIRMPGDDIEEPTTPERFFRKVIGLAAFVIIGLILMIGGLSSYYRVYEGEAGVLLRNGGFVAVKGPGLNFKVPYIDTVAVLEIRNMKLETELHIYSSDTQQYTSKVSVNYEIPEGNVEHLYKHEGLNYATRRLEPIVERRMKEVAGLFTAQRTIQERGKFGDQVQAAIIENAKEYGIKVTSVQVENIDFTDEFEKGIENAMLEKAKVEKERQILEQKRIQAETVVVEATAGANALREKAKGEADAKITQANAEAQRITEIGNAEASAIQKKAQALANNPELTSYTYALAAQNWNGALPQQFVPGSSLPMLNLTPKIAAP